MKRPKLKHFKLDLDGIVRYSGEMGVYANQLEAENKELKEKLERYDNTLMNDILNYYIDSDYKIDSKLIDILEELKHL